MNSLAAGPRTRIRSLLQGGFCAASALVLWGTLVHRGGIERHFWDKGLHFSAFYLLAMLAAVAWPTLRLRWIGVGLLGFGLFIEAAQRLPFVHRDASWGDFVADGLGIALALGPIALDRLRRALT